MKTLHKDDSLRSNYKCSSLLAGACCAVALLLPCTATSAIKITQDPALLSATMAQSLMIKANEDSITSVRKKINKAQIAIAAQLERIHELQSQSLKYMSEASNVLTNLSQFKDIGLKSAKIISTSAQILKEIPDNPEGAVISAFCYSRYKDIASEVTGMVTLVTDLVANTTYGGEKKEGGSDSKKHVNLLSSAERYYVLMDVMQRLGSIQMDLDLIRYYIRTISWRDLWKEFDIQSYRNAWSAQWEINGVIRQWNKLTNK